MTQDPYSVRMGKRQPNKPDLPMLRGMFLNVYSRLLSEGCFREAFGYKGRTGADVVGTIGPDVEASAFQKLRKPGLLPVSSKCLSYSEDDLFDVIEFLYGIVSKPLFAPLIEDVFDQQIGRHQFRAEVNKVLREYREGYELSEVGEIRTLGNEQLRPLLEEGLASDDEENITSRIDAAVRRFTRHAASNEHKREAVRQLADVLEFLRPEAKQLLPSKDEGELFAIANAFGIRHHKATQKTGYDAEIWLDWIFYCYLNTIHALVKILDRKQGDGTKT
jgi:hypothetical protein